MVRFVSLFLMLNFFGLYAQCVGTRGYNVGQCAPGFSILDREGKTFKSLNSKVTIVNFWATWCKPCLEEIPSLEKLRLKLDPKKIQLISISIDQGGQKDVLKFIERFFNNQWPDFQMAFDPQKKVASQYNTVKVPETFIMDSSGKIVHKTEGIRDWSDSIVLDLLRVIK